MFPSSDFITGTVHSRGQDCMIHQNLVFPTDENIVNFTDKKTYP